MVAPYEESAGRAAVYELLSLAFLYPEAGVACTLHRQAGEAAALALKLGWRELEQPLTQLSHQLKSIDDNDLLEEYIRIFGHSVSVDCSQYESEYGQAHIFQKTQTLADLQGFYRAFGVALSPNLKERADHISVELEFMHLLAFKEAYAQLHGHGEDKVCLCQEAQKAFLARHLAPWIASFAGQMGRKAGGDTPYGALARLLRVYVKAELQAFQLQVVPRAIAPPEDQEDPDCAGCPLLPSNNLNQGG